MIGSANRIIGVGPLTLLVLAVVLSLLVVPALPAAAQTDDNLVVIKDNEAPSNAEIAARLTEDTAFTNVERVLISRDDDFADALAGGLMQSRSPLLLVPSTGPVSDRVLEQIQRLGAESATILGGVDAVGDEVTTQLSSEGLTVDRRQGGSRIETAIDIARSEAPAASTAILARAFAADPNNPTQAFADALGAGAMAAENGWPILLSATEELSAATMSYLRSSDVEEVQIVGGVAALSADVEDQIRAMDIRTVRIAGANRGETAVEIAKARGAETVEDVSHVILIDGTSENGWAGGFAAAGRAALLDAPVLLADGVRLLPETMAFLEPAGARAGFAQDTDLSVTCVVHQLACTEVRRTFGLFDYPLLSLSPLRGQVIQPGQTITATLTPTEEGADAEVLFEGTCIGPAPELVRADSAGQAKVTAASQLPAGACTLEITYEGGDDSLISNGFAYVTEGDPFRTTDQILISSGVVAFGDIIPRTPVYANDRITCTSPGGPPETRDSFVMTAQFQQDGAAGLDQVEVGSDQVITSDDAVCEASITPPTGIGQILWGVYSQTDNGLRYPLALGSGPDAQIDLAELDLSELNPSVDGDLSDLAIRWVLRVTDERPAAPEPPPPGPEGVVFNRSLLPVVCNGQLVQPVEEVGPGATCTAEEIGNDVNYLLVQPNRDVLSAPDLSFTTLADPRPTIVLRQFLVSPRPVGPGGPEVCTLSTPLELGRQDVGAVEAAGATSYHTFALDEARDLRIRADNPFGSQSTGLDPILTLYDEQGTELASNDDEDIGVLRGSRIDMSLPAGAYCLGVSGFGNTAGDYLVAVDLAPSFVDTVAVTPGEPNVFFTYTGEAGDEVILEARQVTPDGTDPFVRVSNDGQTQVLAVNDDGGGGLNSRVEFTMPYTGDVVIRVSSLTGQGEMSFEVTAPGEISVVPTVPVEPEFCGMSTPLELGRQDSGTVEAAGATSYHTFTLDQSRNLRIRADNPFGPQSAGLDPILTVYNAQGTELATNDDEDFGAGQLGSRIDASLPAGEYCIGVSGFGDTAGEYLVAVDPAPAFQDRFEVTSEVSSVTFLYTGEVGDRIILEARQVTPDGTDPFIEVLNDDETEVLAVNDDGGGGLNSRVEFTMPYSGTVVIRVSSLTGQGEIAFEGSDPIRGSTFAAQSAYVLAE